MQRRWFILIVSLQFAFPLSNLAQDQPTIVDRKDYNRNFLLKCQVGTGVVDWRLHFPENVVDTSNRLQLPNENKLRFSGTGSERSILFSALFGLRWGRFGGGFETSRVTIDSLQETVNGQTLNFSYHGKWVGFNRFFIEYETNRIPIDGDKQFYFVANAMAGTYIISPRNDVINYRSMLFLTVGPQVEHVLERWFSVSLSGLYELRYFNTKEQFGSREWVYNNYLNALSLRIGVKFRIYPPGSLIDRPIPSRVE
jgi:hypothetical protein